MSALDILNTLEISSERFNYLSRDIDHQYKAVEILSKNNNVLFREFYYIVDILNKVVYLADFQEPDAVHVERIKKGMVNPHAKVNSGSN